MGKIVFWIVVFIAIMLVVRMINVSKSRQRRDEAASRDRKSIPPAEPTVRCVECGVFLPKSESMPAPAGYRCRPDCGRRR